MGYEVGARQDWGDSGDVGRLVLKPGKFQANLDELVFPCAPPYLDGW